MSGPIRRLLWWGGGLLVLAVVAWVAAWLWVLSGAMPHEHRLSSWPLFPVACTTRGCITSAQWQQQHSRQGQFAVATNSAAPEPRQSLTTAVRQHLVQHAAVQAPATMTDARRYREEVLQAKDPATVERAVGLTLADYDELVVLPLLQQEAIRLERSMESYDELFAALAKERSVGILAWRYRWDTATGSVGAE